MKKKSEFSAAERERIAREYLTGNETARELSCLILKKVDTLLTL